MKFEVKKFSAVKPFIVMGVLGVFLLAQPDLGSTVVLFVITFGMLFIVGANFWQFILLIWYRHTSLCLVGSFGLLSFKTFYRFLRAV